MPELTEHQEEGALDARMEETIRETLGKIRERPTEETGLEPAATVAPAATRKTGETSETTETKPETAPKRDESGRFLPKSTEAEKSDSAPPLSSPAVPSPDGEGSPAAGAEPILSTTGQPLDITRPPSSWKPVAKAQWNALPEPVRAEIYRRESDFLNGNKTLRDTADFGSTMRQAIEPYRMLIESEGGTPERAVGELLKTAALFRIGTPEQKLGALFQLDRQFNTGLQGYINAQVQRAQSGQQVQQATPPVQQQPFTDPRVDQILASLQQQERARAAEQERVSTAAVEVFTNAKDDKGNLLYPFVDNVLDDMSARAQVIRRANPAMEHDAVLKQAYEAAVWANPETRAVLLGQQQSEASQAVENLRKTEQARRASAGNMPKRGTLPAREPAPGASPLTQLDDTIRETGRALGMF